MATSRAQHGPRGGLARGCRAGLLTALLLAGSVPALATRLLSSAAAPGPAPSPIDGITSGLESSGSEARFACPSNFRWVLTIPDLAVIACTFVKWPAYVCLLACAPDVQALCAHNL